MEDGKVPALVTLFHLPFAIFHFQKAGMFSGQLNYFWP